jgi:hypothetical protein
VLAGDAAVRTSSSRSVYAPVSSGCCCTHVPVSQQLHWVPFMCRPAIGCSLHRSAPEQTNFLAGNFAAELLLCLLCCSGMVRVQPAVCFSLTAVVTGASTQSSTKNGGRQSDQLIRRDCLRYTFTAHCILMLRCQTAWVPVCGCCCVFKKSRAGWWCDPVSQLPSTPHL